MPGGNIQPSLDFAEHIGNDGDGENIHAKRVGSYVWDEEASEWTRATPFSHPAYDRRAGFSASANNTNVFSEEVLPYRSFSIHILGTWSGTLTLQCSNDNSDWRTTGAKFTNNVAQQYTTTFTSNGVIEGPISFQYLRLRFTAFTSGTATAILVLHTEPHFPTSIGIDTELPAAAASTDGANNPTAPFVQAAGQLFNGSTWDRRRGAVTAAVIAAGTVNNQTDQPITNYNGSSLAIVLNVSAVSTGTVTVTIDGTTASGYQYNILTGAAVSTTGVVVYRAAPALTAAANAVAQDIVPRNIRVSTAVTGTITYGVDYILGV